MDAYRYEVWTVAEALMSAFGTDAAARAWAEVETHRDDPHPEDLAFWIEVLAAICDWQRPGPATGDTIH